MKIALTEGYYQAKSIIASAQSCLNLYPEKDPQSSTFPFTDYLTPGIVVKAPAPMGNVNTVRCTYRASNGQFYTVVGNTIYSVSSNFTLTSLGTITPNVTTPVSMQDNGIVILVGDGSPNLWVINLTDPAYPLNSFASVISPNIYGADKIDYLDTFLLLNRPGTNQFYITLSAASYGMFAAPVGSLLLGSITEPGIGYIDGTYVGVPFIGGTGSGGLATIVVAGGIITSVTVTTPGTDYSIGDILTAVINGSGAIATGSITNAGSAYTNGTYTATPLTGGEGSGAIATIVISGNIVTSVTITTNGTGYNPGDVLEATIPGGTGFQWTIDTVSNGTGFQWTVGTVGGSAFDPLDIAAKVGYPDPIVSLIVMHREIWLVGQLTTEVWYNAGAADFPFQIMPGVFVEHGSVAKYSLCAQDLNTYWITQDEQGQVIAVKGNDYTAKRISTHAIENVWSQYSTVSDAICFAYQQEGHTFVIYTFPTANATWVFDEAAGLWHQRGFCDNNGGINRIRANCFANVFGMSVVGDWQNGQLYQMSLNYVTDSVDGNGLNPDGSYPIVRQRSWPALMNEDKRLSYQKFIADMEVGEDQGTIDQTTDANPPGVFLAWSNDRGRTYSNNMEQSLGGIGKYLTVLQWRRLGLGRGRVFQLTWSCPAITALNGAWIDVTEAAT